MIKSCHNCPDRIVKVEDGKVITCKSTCKDYKIYKLEKLHKSSKQVKENMLVSGMIERGQKLKRKKMFKHTSRFDNES